jgi:hypothetical protein
MTVEKEVYGSTPWRKSKPVPCAKNRRDALPPIRRTAYISAARARAYGGGETVRGCLARDGAWRRR